MTCIGFLILFHCYSAAVASPELSFCDGVKPIYWSANDTRQTKEQADTLNRKWKQFCAKKAP